PPHRQPRQPPRPQPPIRRDAELPARCPPPGRPEGRLLVRVKTRGIKRRVVPSALTLRFRLVQASGVLCARGLSPGNGANRSHPLRAALRYAAPPVRPPDERPQDVVGPHLRPRERLAPR